MMTDTETYANPFKSQPASADPSNPYDGLAKQDSARSSSSAQPAMVAVDVNKKLQEIQEREKLLSEKENLLKAREKEFGSNGEPLPSPRNWPPYCPLVHYSIAEVPDDHKLLVRTAFFYLHIFILALVWNLVCEIVEFSVTCVVTSAVYLVVGVVVSWKFQFNTLYRALKSEVVSDARILIFLINFLFAVAFNLLMAIGFGCGAGLAEVIEAGSYTTCIFYSISFCLWTTASILSIYILKKAIKLWKSSGGNMDKAKKDVVSAAVTSTMSDTSGSWGEQAKDKKSRDCSIM